MPVLLDSAAVPPDERLEHCRAGLAALPVPLEFTLDSASRIRSSRILMAALGPVVVTQVTHLVDGAGLIDRSPPMIRRADPEIYRLMLHLDGANMMSQDGRESALTRHGMALFDSSRPFRVRLRPGREPVHRYAMLTFPRRLLAVDERAIRAATACRLDTSGPLGSLVQGFVGKLTRDCEEYGEREAARLATTALDLLAVWLSAELDTDGVPPESRHRALLARSQSFIAEHLADPALSPHTVADAHHVSLRTLQGLFAGEGLTVTGWIRERRLEACRRDLANPRLDQVAVATIGRRWGFESAAHFSRLFRQAYGMSPRAFRALHFG